MTSLCSLCHSQLRIQIIQEQEHCFCCVGCQTVFKILSALAVQENFKDHPLFQQALKTGLISNPELLRELELPQPEVPLEERNRLYLEIREMWCPSCAELIALLLKRQKGILHCVIDYTTDLACIEYSPRYLAKEAILSSIRQFGYDPVVLEMAQEHSVSKTLTLRFVIAAFFSLNVMMFAYPLYASYFDGDPYGYGMQFAWISLVCSLPVVTYCFWPILKRFHLALRTGFVGMETLVVLGVTSAFGLSLYEMWHGSTQVYFDSMTVLIALMLLGKMIEARAKFSAKEALMRLTKATPRRGRKCLFDGSESFVPLKEIAIGDRLMALQGEKIVLDGIVLEGEGYCNESLLTGEVAPIFKASGSRVVAGSILQQGKLVYQATADAQNSTLQQIIGLVEQELIHKAPYVRAADRIVRIFVPAVILLAFGVAFGVYFSSGSIQEACLRAITVLLISCPCALGIAAPVAEAHLLNSLASLGILVRNRGILKHLGQETVFVFDKTGTVTVGRFQILGGLETLNAHQKVILKSLAHRSIHPLSVSIARMLNEKPIVLNFIEEITGRGLRAWHENKRYLLGSKLFLKESGITIAAEALVESNVPITTLYFADGEDVYPIHLGDQIREGVIPFLKSLSAKKLLISGDSEQAVSHVAKACGFDAWMASCTPEEKQKHLKLLRERGEKVAMLGDGINDAPALAEAHVGISVLSATDLSVQASDILLTTEQLDVLRTMRPLAQKGRRIIAQNLFWAFAYNVLGLGLAAAGLLSPLFAAFAMVASSIIVTLNAQRLK